MALNGNDVVMVSETAKAHDMTSFLELVRRENASAPIIPIMDNAQIHRARLTGEKAEDLDIIRAFLPPYSPDLNPIEFPWKDMKRELAAKLNFDDMVDASGPTALKLFDERRDTYTSRWVESFIAAKS